jgi:hypothetical protein
MLSMLAGCGGNGGGSDAAAPSDAHMDTAPAENPSACPAAQPQDRAACSGTIACGYGGTTVCCGISYLSTTCRCQGGVFSCGMTIECNFVCPDAGP